MSNQLSVSQTLAMASQHSTTAEFSSRYKFNAKELDQETGWYYYGARYYDPSVSQWISIDPLLEKYPAFNPYNYTMNNPIMLVDPDGRAVDTDFIILKNKSERGKVGDIVRADVNDGSENDTTDRILETDSNDNVITSTKREGGLFSKKVRDSNGNVVKEKNVGVKNIAKGILYEGQNLEVTGSRIKFGGEGQASFEDVRDFLVGLSDFVNKEIAGYEALFICRNQKVLWTYKYSGNTKTRSKSPLFVRRGVKFLSHFHTHPYGEKSPSKDIDIPVKARRNRYINPIPHYIYYKSGNTTKSNKY